MSPTRHFCCCLPVRLGAFVLSVGSILGSGAYAATIWYAIYMSANNKELRLDKQQEASFIIAGTTYSCLFILSIVGLIGAITRKCSLVAMYSRMLWYMVGFQLASGAFFIYTLYRQKESTIQKCILDLQATNPGQNVDARSACEIATRTWKIAYIIVFIITLLLHGYSALIVSRYVEQLTDEQSYRHTQPSTGAAFSTHGSGAAYYPHHPLGQSTDNLTQQHEGKQGGYDFVAPNQSYGRANV